MVADQYMQRMDGLEFLKRVREKSPGAMGIIMTTYNEITGALDTLYLGCVYRFVKKPLDNNEIKQAIMAAITQYEINARSKGK